MSDDNALEFLAANGLFCCNGNNDVFCSICTTDARLDSWEKHIVDPTHVQTLEQFNQIFERIASRSHCRLCGEDFDWRVLKSHARSHTILPWHRPYNEYDKYKIFFDNRIIEWKSLFHCCICNVTFSKFDVAFLHIVDPTHQSHKEKIASLIYQFPTEAVTYDFLVSECLIASTETALECRICGSAKVSVDSVSRHVKALMHQSNRSKFRLEFIERKAEEPVVQPNNHHLQSDESVSEESAAEDSDSEESTPEKVEACALTDDRPIVPQSSACNYIVKHSSTDSYCIICNCVLFHHSTNNHMRDKEHVDALKAYGCDKILFTNNSEYYCTICNRNMTGPASVYSHIVGNKHLKSLSTLRQDRVRTRPIDVRPIKQPEKDTNEVSEPERSYHAESREKSKNSDNISLLEDNAYYCKCCKVTISGPKNLYLHLKGKRHLHSCNLSERQQPRMQPHSLEALRRPDINLGTEKDSLPSLSNTFGKRQIGTGCLETPKTWNGNVLKTEECRLGLPDISDKPQIQIEKSLKSLEIPNVDSQTKEEHYSTWENTFALQHVGISRDNIKTPTRPEVFFHAKDERRADSPNETDNRRAHRPGSLVIPRKPKHIPERIFENVQTPNVNSQTEEEHYVTWENTFGLQQVEKIRDSSETLTRPEVAFHTKEEDRVDSSNENEKRQAQRGGPLVIPRKPKHIPERIFESLKTSNMNSQPKEEHYSTWENTFDLQQVGISRDSSETPTRPEVVFHAKDEDRVDSPNETEKRQAQRGGPFVIPRKPKHIPERIFESLKTPNVNLQRKEEYHPTWDNIFGLQQVGISRDKFETSTTPDAVVHAEDERRSASPNEIAKRQAQNPPRRSEHLPKRMLESSTCDYFVRLKEGHLRCEVCDCTISDSSANINIHVTGNYHVASLKKYGTDYVTAKGDDIYYCECCDVAMVHAENVHLHIKNDRHINVVAQLNRQKLSTGEKTSEKIEMPVRILEKLEALLESACPTSSSIYILKKNATVSHCELCDVDLVGTSETSDHVASADHAAAMEKHGCDSVVLVGGDDYHCVSCKCNISGCENVFLHIKGRRHFFGLHQLSDRQKLQMAKRNLNKLKTSEGQNPNTALSLVTTEMTKMMKKWRILEKKSRQN